MKTLIAGFTILAASMAFGIIVLWAPFINQDTATANEGNEG